MIPSTTTTVTSLFGIFAVWLLSKIVQSVRRSRRSTPLNGPPSKSLVFGYSRDLHASTDSALVYEEWGKQYGSVYRVPFAFGSTRIILNDPKAIAHFYAQETFTYVRSSMSKRGVERLVGRGLLWAEGDSHKRQRKALSPAFTTAAIRTLTPIFYDSAYKVKSVWDALIESSDSGYATIDVQGWMNHVSLDTIGIAGFSHDFRALHGEQSEVMRVFEAIISLKPSVITIIAFVLQPVFPFLGYVPTQARKLFQRLNNAMGAISATLVQNSKRIDDQKSGDKSALGLLLKAENKDKDMRLSPDEVLAQMKVLLLAGYETTSITLTWALLELCQKPEIQVRLREEILEFSSSDPTHEQLTNSLPYLDAVVHECLRLHPPLGDTTRIASTDDIIPLSAPIIAKNGRTADSLAVAEGTTISIPIACINRSELFWGPDAKEFKPERWITEGGLDHAKELQGHRHLLTFTDGPRICLGKGFALAEMKAVLFTLIKNFKFELKEGTKIEMARGILPRPKVAGEEGAKLPLMVRRVE